MGPGVSPQELDRGQAAGKIPGHPEEEAAQREDLPWSLWAPTRDEFLASSIHCLVGLDSIRPPHRMAEGSGTAGGRQAAHQVTIPTMCLLPTPLTCDTQAACTLSCAHVPCPWGEGDQPRMQHLAPLREAFGQTLQEGPAPGPPAPCLSWGLWIAGVPSPWALSLSVHSTSSSAGACGPLRPGTPTLGL